MCSLEVGRILIDTDSVSVCKGELSEDSWSTSKQVAVKFYNQQPDTKGLETLTENFENKKKIYQDLRPHPNVAACFAFGKDFFVEELMEHDLGVFIHTKLRAGLTFRDLLSIFQQIAIGLEYLSKNGVVHFDMKPANVLLAKKGDKYIAKVGNLDLSKQRKGEGLQAQWGTDGYMAPELLEALVACSPVDTRKLDVYSLGVVMWESVTGSFPGEADSPDPEDQCPQLFELIRQCTYRAASSRPDWDDVIKTLQMMEANPLKWIDRHLPRRFVE